MKSWEVIQFTRGQHLFQIVPDYEANGQYLGIRDGRIAVRGLNKAQVAYRLIGKGQISNSPS